MAREDVLIRIFVELADVWVGDFDLEHVSLMVAQRCVELFDASAAGVLLSDPSRDLRVAASSSPAMRDAQLLEIRAGHGPGIDCYRTGTPIVAPDLNTTRESWPRFAPAARAAGFRSVHAAPVRVRDQTIGALNLFRGRVGKLSDADALAAQAIAHAMAFTILQQQRPNNEPSSSTDAGPALDEVLLFEQARGVLAGRAGVSIDEASQRIRRYARYHDLNVKQISEEIVKGTLDLLSAAETLRRRRHNL